MHHHIDEDACIDTVYLVCTLFTQLGYALKASKMQVATLMNGAVLRTQCSPDKRSCHGAAQNLSLWHIYSISSRASGTWC
eukprot:m.361647 g.361647  ORF g.361647 m.361647 type:complete len:80 (-) comp19746_c0_seq1:1770-2009(-)